MLGLIFLLGLTFGETVILFDEQTMRNFPGLEPVYRFLFGIDEGLSPVLRGKAFYNMPIGYQQSYPNRKYRHWSFVTFQISTLASE